MDRFSRQVMDKLPLAESVLQVLSHALDSDYLEAVFKQSRGSSYTKVITFPVLTRLISEALIASKSGRRTFEAAREEGTLPASVEAAYKKLRRIPVAVSTAMLNGCSQRVRSLLPEVDSESSLPKSLAGWAAIVVDGKVTKGVPHRLKPLRGQGGGLVGGKGLVAYHLESGLVVGLEADEDGDANDVRLLPGLLPSVRAAHPGRRLWIADRQFSFLSTLAAFAGEDDAYLVRYSKGIPYQRDANRASRTGQDSEGRSYDDEWGWLGKEKAAQRCFVRRITLNRGSKDAIVLVTNLMDADRYPAADLLETYRDRPNIESVFQRITEVLALRRLIGTSPRATVFQLSLCLLLYNVLQLVRSYLASNADRSVSEVSPKKLLEDVRDELASCQTVLGTEKLADLEKPDSTETLQQLLTDRLGLWKARWGKAKRRRNRPEKPKCGSRHDSAFRLLEKTKLLS